MYVRIYIYVYIYIYIRTYVYMHPGMLTVARCIDSAQVQCLF